jgi:hypothetical protein
MSPPERVPLIHLANYLFVSPAAAHYLLWVRILSLPPPQPTTTDKTSFLAVTNLRFGKGE